ncbi:cupin domain-containing protein [Streptomyces sp. SP17BM10]|uniref:cupin domain-containing protein n=1 Tax=Streptomyces sp. SP17BM10 TaxID=3002530 RepID=UPI002E791F52|nr:cupin domain-containing protein [Streptomyces sp. SP17BM10]MEE1782570.1 cupin domain-containing protein [Streptomyces sp. SP17BM10]
MNLVHTASSLPGAWESAVLAEVGTAAVKVLRMDGRPLPPEAHATAEALVVVDGRLELVVDGEDFTIESGELCRIPGGAVHAVRPGSRGTLLIIEVPAPASSGTINS